MTEETNRQAPKIYIQVAQSDGPVQAESASDDVIEATRETLVNVKNLVRESWSNIVAEIGKGENAHKEVTIEFGVGIGAEGSIPFIAKGSMNANFNVSIVWKNEG